MTFCTFSRVSARRSGELLMTRDTVFLETPASRATSLMVTGLPPVRLLSATPEVLLSL